LVSKHPSMPAKPITAVQEQHNAPEFGRHLKEYLNSFRSPALSTQNLQHANLPVDNVDIFHQFRFQKTALHDEAEELEPVKATAKSKSLSHGRFDTVIVVDQHDAEATALEGTRVGRVKVIFKLPTIIEQPGVRMAAPDSWPTKHLAYVEWYTRQGTSPNKTNGMYQISNAVDSNGWRSGAIVPLANIRQ
ncbi:hypothetical protein BKA70DRAFT_1057446, partial [Coprinopsis sp. MPI-PUGE-AT-0042]